MSVTLVLSTLAMGLMRSTLGRFVPGFVVVFVLAWLMLGKNRWIALLLFALSFTVQSLLVFYALPMLELLVRSRAWTSPRSLAWWAISKIDLLLLPFVWFAIKRTYFKPTDYYVSYNENFAWKNLSAAARQQVALYRASPPGP